MTARRTGHAATPASPRWPPRLGSPRGATVSRPHRATGQVSLWPALCLAGPPLTAESVGDLDGAAPPGGSAGALLAPLEPGPRRSAAQGRQAERGPDSEAAGPPVPGGGCWPHCVPGERLRGPRGPGKKAEALGLSPPRHRGNVGHYQSGIQGARPGAVPRTGCDYSLLGGPQGAPFSAPPAPPAHTCRRRPLLCADRTEGASTARGALITDRHSAGPLALPSAGLPGSAAAGGRRARADFLPCRPTRGRCSRPRT